MIPFLKTGLKLVALSLTAFALASTAVAKKNKDLQPTSYPVRDHLVHLGSVDPSAREWERVDAPRSAIEAAKGVLKGEPSHWKVSRQLNYPTIGKEVVFLEDGKDHYFVCWVRPERWVRLNEKNSISALNALTKDLPGRNLFAANVHDRSKYVQYIANMYGGGCRAILSDWFLKDVGGAKSDQGKPWVTGTENNPEEFYKLCHDPVVSRNGIHVNVEFTVLVFGGSAEDWILSGTWDRGFIIRSIDAKVLRKPGTFRWNCF